MRLIYITLMGMVFIWAFITTKPYNGVLTECQRQSGMGSGFETNASPYLYNQCMQTKRNQK